jgi:hypothetical protein
MGGRSRAIDRASTPGHCVIMAENRPDPHPSLDDIYAAAETLDKASEPGQVGSVSPGANARRAKWTFNLGYEMTVESATNPTPEDREHWAEAITIALAENSGRYVALAGLLKFKYTGAKSL